MTRLNTNAVTCLCGRRVPLARAEEAQRERSEAMRAFACFNGVCACGRGVDVSIELQPASEAEEVVA